MPSLQFAEGVEPWTDPSSKKQLLNHLVDGKARTRPEAVWAKVPKDPTTYDAGYRKITYLAFANAVNGIASWILQHLGRSSTFETIAYFGVWDPRYIIVTLGAVKAGYKVVTPSLDYPVQGLINLLNRLECKTILTASKDFPIVGQLQGHAQHPIHQIPALNELLETHYEHVPFDKTFEEAESEPLMVIHTSGTTGIPKPLILTHGWTAAWIEHNQLNPPAGYTSIDQLNHGIELCAATPPFHCSGYFPNFWGAIPNDITCIFPLPRATLSLETAASMIQHNDPSFLIAPPQLLVGLSMDKRLMNQVSEKVTQIGYGGGPLPEAAGVLLSQHFRVFPIYGTSEMGLVSKISQSSSWDSDGWRGLTPHPRDNLQFRHLKGDLYEGVVVRNDDGKETQAVFKLFPELKEWSTKDIFTPDPKRKGHWIYQSRVDDVIILSDGGTVNPLGFEQQLMKAPFISQALLAGSGKSKTALLVEPQEQLEDMLERLWEKVQECNAIFPPQATVSKSHIIVVDPARPLPKAGKGNVQRMPAYQLYRQEIDALY